MFDSTLTRYAYVMYLSDKKIHEVILLLGTTHQQVRIDTTTEKAYLIPSSLKGNEIVFEKAIYLFLTDTGFIETKTGRISDKGKAYFRMAYVLKENEQKRIFLQSVFLRNPVTALISQVFYGRGKITPQQVKLLLLNHQIIDDTFMDSDLSSFLMLINKYGIIAYYKKTATLHILVEPEEKEPIQQYFVEPTLPFSNINNFRKVLRSCYGNIYWLDKHFRKQGFEIIVDGLPANNLKSITIISGTKNASEGAKEDYLKLREELSYRNIALNWKLITDDTFLKKWHDRWIVADNCSYNIPPILSIIQGQRAEIIKTEKSPNIQEFLNYSIDFI